MVRRFCERGIKAAQARAYLIEGDGWLWTLDRAHGWVFVRSAAAVAEHLGLEHVGVGREVPLRLLRGRSGPMAATLAVYYRERGTISTRAGTAEDTGISSRQQQRIEKAHPDIFGESLRVVERIVGEDDKELSSAEVARLKEDWRQVGSTWCDRYGVLRLIGHLRFSKLPSNKNASRRANRRLRTHGKDDLRSSGAGNINLIASGETFNSVRRAGNNLRKKHGAPVLLCWGTTTLRAARLQVQS